MRRIMKAAVVAAIPVIGIATATAASASVNVTDGVGFVGKGDVQTALGWNNAALQSNAISLKFTMSQPAAQALSRSATQGVSQTATQSMSQDVTCTLETGQKTFHRDGERDGSRSGSRSGTQVGTQAGALNGTVSSTVAYDARSRNQITGFNLTGQTIPVFTASGAESWNDPSFTVDPTWGNASLGEVAWGGWDAAPGENPADCLGGNPGVTDLDNIIIDGTVQYGDIVPGTIAYGDTFTGSASATGPAVLLVNGVALLNTPAV